MESVRKRLKKWADNVLSVFKVIKTRKKWILQLASILILLIISLLIYFKINSKSSYNSSVSYYGSKLLNEAITQYRLENYQRAEILFKSLLSGGKCRRNKSINSLALLFLGNIKYKEKLYQKALLYYSKIYNYKRLKKIAYYNSAIAELQRGKINNAIEYVKKSIKNDRLFSQGDLLLGNIYYLKGDYIKAIKVYNRHSGNPVFLYNKAITYQKIGKKAESESIFISLLSREDVSKVLKGLVFYRLADLYKYSSPDKASNYYLQAYKIFNQNDTLLYNASIEMSIVGDYVKAAKLLTNINIEDVSKDASMDESIEYGYIFYKAGSFRKAIDILIPIEKSSCEANIILGDIYLKNGKLKKSLNYYMKALALSKDKTQKLLVYDKLISLYVKLRMLEKAEELCSSLDKDSKNKSSLLISCSNLFFERNKTEKALDLMSKALEKAGNNRTVLFRIANTYLKYGYYNNALKVLYKIRNKYPNNCRALLAISGIFFKKGQVSRAVNQLDIIESRCKNIDIVYDARMLKANNIKDNESENIFKELIFDFPYRYEAYFNLARLYLSSAKYEKAVNLIDKMFKSVNEIPKKVRVNGYIIKGIAYFRMGNSKEAYNAFLNAISLDKENEMARVNMHILKSLNY